MAKRADTKKETKSDTYYTKADLKALRAEVQRYNMIRLKSFDRARYATLAKVCNGIGAEWMPKWARRITTFCMRKIESCACVHDWDYEFLPTSYWNFSVANLRLFYNSCKKCEFRIGFFSFIICQVAGWKAFKDGKLKAIKDNNIKEVKQLLKDKKVVEKASDIKDE